MPIEQINGTTLAHEEAGAGQPLVLVHGAWSDSSSWGAVVPGLARSFRVVTYDLRGHGASALDPPDAGTVHDDVADLAALVEHLGLGPVHLAGISSGACIALRAAAAHPAMVRRVAAHEPPAAEHLAGDPTHAAALGAMGDALGRVMGDLRAGDHLSAAERFFPAVIDVPWSDLPSAAQEAALAHATACRGQLGDPDATALPADVLGAVTAEVVLTVGDRSPWWASPITDRLVPLLPHASRRTLPGVGHVPHATHPDAYVAALEGVLLAS